MIGIVVAVVLLFVKTVPTGFLPDEDQGYLMADIQLPNAASLGRTQEVIDQLQEVLSKNDNIQSVTAAAGFSLLSGTEAPNSGLVFIRLKDYKQRKMTADEISDMLNGELYEAINSAEVFTFGPPSIPGLGPGSGFTIMIQDKGGNTPQYLAQYTDKFIGEARKRPEIASINTLYQADIPQKAIRINNEKVLKAGVSLQDLHEKISAYLGGSYVNNFNRFGRMYQTYIQAASEYRLTQSDLDLFYITNNRGESLPIASFITVKDTTGPQYTNRFNLYRAASVTGQPAKGYSTGETMQALEEVAARVLPSDMGYAWSQHVLPGRAHHRRSHGFPLRHNFHLPDSGRALRKLVAAAEHYSRHSVRGFRRHVVHLPRPFTESEVHQRHLPAGIADHADRVGRQECDPDRRICQSKIRRGSFAQGCGDRRRRLRVRPVIMTAFAFLMGVIPLIFATGSNAVARNVMGLGLFGGMLIATLIGIFAYPALFVWIGKIGKYEQKRTAKQQEMTNSEHHE